MKTNAIMLILLGLTYAPLSLVSQEINQWTTDPKLGIQILYGLCDRSALETGDFGDIFKEYHAIYEPEKKTVTELKGLIKGAEITIVLGTWCSDSQEQVPRFFKVLDRARYDSGKVKIICVNSDKEAGKEDISGLGIKKVPTFIVSRNGAEAGRIIETPYVSLEKDLLMFLQD